MPLFRRKPKVKPIVHEADASHRHHPSHPVVERREFTLPDLDPAHDGVRIVQLTDIHAGKGTPARRIRAAVEYANLFEPDLVVMTGDYLCHDPRNVGEAREQLAGLKAPTVTVLGNHDHWVDADGATNALESLGYVVLRNQNTSVTLRGEPFTIIGIDDLLTGNADVNRAFRGAGDGSRIALAHVPSTADQLKDHRATLCLSGHTHGGHVNIPVFTPAILRSIANEPYLAGRFSVEKTQLYVSRGIGGAVMPVRFNAPPEVTLLTLRSGHPDRQAA